MRMNTEEGAPKARSGVTGEGEKLIEQWLKAEQAREQAQKSLTNALNNAQQTESNLARWLLPDDAKTGEVISIWFGDSLIQVQCTQTKPNRGVVSIRQSGKSISEARWA